ncbi:MAG TPA: hypothetical protein VE664_09355 [Actinomycetes bacterium]|jgi:hypothetical protein|nr:hypothetical protein [Actinomycetes bacterium]
MADPVADPGADTAAFADAVAKEADLLLRAAEARRLTLRLTGSLGVSLHSPGSRHLLGLLGRRHYRDIDVMGVWKQQRAVSHMFEERGYLPDPDIKQAQDFGSKRLIYQHPETGIKVDVFMDDLVMAHTVPFGRRLELDSPTISVTDLLLSKLQIHEITENDLIDMVVLLADHDLGAREREAIDHGYVASLLAKDWGFWWTTMSNLEKLDAALDRYQAVPVEMAGTVRERVATLRRQLEATPKSGRWKLRARVGTRVRWYEEVQEVHR